MHRSLTIHAYDALDKIVVAATVREGETSAMADQTVVGAFAATIDSTGSECAHDWTRDILVTLVEGL